MGRVKSKFFGKFDEDGEFCFSEPKKLIEKIGDQKICLEIGTGNGKFFSHLVQRNPDLFCVGCDLRKDRLIKTKIKTEELTPGVKNFAFSSGDARELLDFLQNGSVEKFFMNFPDPRNPKKEWKYRFFQLDVIEILHKKLAKGGKLFIKTDDFEYFYFTRSAFFFKKDLFREDCHSKDVYKDQDTGGSDYICTEFEERWLKEGKKIFELVFEKK